MLRRVFVIALFTAAPLFANEAPKAPTNLFAEEEPKAPTNLDDYLAAQAKATRFTLRRIRPPAKAPSVLFLEEDISWSPSRCGCSMGTS